MLTAIGVFAHSGIEKANKAVFGDMVLPDFTDASVRMCNCLMFNNVGIRICPQPTKLQFGANPEIRTGGEPKKQNALVCTQFALDVPTISSVVRERRLATESQQKDLESTFVDDGKEVEKCHDGEFIKNTSLLILYGLVWWSSELLLDDRDNDGIPNIFE